MIKKPLSSSEKRCPPEIQNFEEGLRIVRERITELLAIQKQVTVAINGAGPKVGKTRFAGSLAKCLLEQRIPVGVCLDNADLDKASRQRDLYANFFDEAERGVYVLESWEPPHGIKTFGNIDLREAYDGRFRLAAKSIGLPLDKIDVWVALFSPQTPFGIPPAWQDMPYDPFEDVIICNERAKNKK